MSDELKPCPFCGGEVKLKADDSGGYSIECGNHDWPKGFTQEIPSQTIAGDVLMCSWGQGKVAKQALIEAWNTRTDDTSTDEKHVPSLKESTEDTQVFTDSRELLEADVREICWGHDYYRRDAQKRYLHERGLDVRENIVTTNYDGHVLATVIMHMLDRQDSITERELCDRCSPYATAKDYLDTIDSLTAERDGLRKQLAEKQRVCDIQRDSFAKLERENRELQDVCGELERTLENLRND